MKQLFYILSLTALCSLLAACGGKNKYENNDVLGKYPSIFMVLNEDRIQWQDECREKAKAITDMQQGEKIQKEYEAKDETLQKEAFAVAAKELECLINKTVPFEMKYSDPDFEIQSATIEGGNVPTGNIDVNFKITAKHDIQASPHAGVYFIVIDKNGESLAGTVLCPFVSVPVRSASQFPNGVTISAGKLCCEQGCRFTLDCMSYNFTSFAKIVFVSAEEYNSL